MKSLFLYNWQVRDEWFDVCAQLSHEELLKERTGGVGSILKTLFHIADVEYSWMLAAEGKEAAEPKFEDFATLSKVRALSDSYVTELRPLILSRSPERDGEIVKAAWHAEPLRYREVAKHVIAHEIHHMGQLSVWAKELHVPRVSANFIGRGLGEQ